MSQLVRRGSAMLGLSASLSSLSSSNKSLLTLSTKDKSDAFQNRDSARQSKARALSLATAGVNGTVFKAVWNNPLLTISQKEALFPTGLVTFSLSINVSSVSNTLTPTVIRFFHPLQATKRCYNKQPMKKPSSNEEPAPAIPSFRKWAWTNLSVSYREWSSVRPVPMEV